MARQANTPADFGKVAVLYGGNSAERPVSLESGKSVLQGLKNKGVDAHGIDKGDDVIEVLRAGGYTRVFNILHGRGGEDGTIQGALDVCGIPYTGSGVLGSALSMDKYRSKLAWDALAIPTPVSSLVNEEAALQSAAESIGFPVAVKPVHEGSSIGITKATDGESLHSAWWKANQFDNDVILERWIEGPEYTASILGERSLPLIRLETPHEFYDYDAKYADGQGTQYHCPCGLDDAEESRIAEASMKAFKALGCTGWGRVDLMCDAEGNAWFLDVNTAPGMTSHSLVPMAASAVGIDFDTLVWTILEGTLA